MFAENLRLVWAESRARSWFRPTDRRGPAIEQRGSLCREIGIGNLLTQQAELLQDVVTMMAIDFAEIEPCEPIALEATKRLAENHVRLSRRAGEIAGAVVEDDVLRFLHTGQFDHDLAVPWRECGASALSEDGREQ